MASAYGFEAWSLLGPSATGHKLRLRIPDTAVIEDNVLKAWLYTDKQTGVLHATSRSKLSTAALLHNLQGQHAAYAVDNPQGWVAVAYFANCITRLVTAAELEELLSRVYVGAVPEDAAAKDAAGNEGLQLLALQAYVVPADDARYITTFGGVEGVAMLTQVHSYSSRFSAGASSKAAAEAAKAAIQQAVAAGAAAAAAGSTCLGQNQAAVIPEGLTSAAAAAGRSSCCGSVISLCSHAGDSSDCGTAAAQQQQRTQSMLGRVAAAGGAELVLRTAQLDQQLEGCATPTMAAGRSSVADMPGPQPCCCNSSEAGICGCHSSCGYAAGAAAPEQNASSSGSHAGASLAADAGSCSMRAAPGAVSRAAAAALQLLVSYIDKAHGVRVQGMAAEFIKDASEQLWLVGLHSVTLDPQQSRGSAATFTERWGEFLAGAGPPPAPHLSQHTSYGRNGQSATGCESPTHSSSAPASPAAEQQREIKAAGSSSGRDGGGCSAMGRSSPFQQLNRQFFPLLTVDVSELPSCRPQSATAAATAAVRGSTQPSSAPRCTRAASPQLTRPSSCSPSRQRPAAAAALLASVDSLSAVTGRGGCGGVLGGCSTLGSNASTRSTLGQAGGARYTSRNAASAARPGAGGNPTSKPTSSDSYALWMQQPLRPSDSVTAQLASQLEWAKAQLQRYADLAEAAQLQAGCTVEQATQHVASVQQELLQLRHDAAAASRERRQLQQHTSELEAQHSSTGAAMLQLHQQLADVQEQLAQDRATMATMLRQHQQQKQQLEEDVGQLQQQNGELRGMALQLQSRLEEESEVVSALRAQLVDYKLQMEQMQLQAKKGRSLYNSSSTAGRRGGSTTPPGQLQGPAGSLGMGLSSSGITAFANTSSSGLGAAGVATLDGAGGQQQAGGGSWSQRSLNLPAAQRPATAPLSLSLPGKTPAHALPAATSSQVSQSATSSGSGSASGSSVRSDHTASSKAAASSYSTSNSRRSTGEYFAAMLGPNLYGASADIGASAKINAASCSTSSLQQRQQQQQQPNMQLLTGSLLQGQSQPGNRDSFAASSSLPSAVTPSRRGSSTGGSTSRSMTETELQGKLQPSAEQQQQQRPGPTATIDTRDPDAAVAAITAAITADIGEPLAATSNSCRARPQLFIGDLLVGPSGSLLPTAEQQLAVISGLFQQCAGDLLEIYGYYALLGGSAQVVADRMTMDLCSLGKIAFDLHICQDNKSLSAVEDVFYLLSDRRPCLALRAKTRPPSAEPASNRPGHRASSITCPSNLLNGAAAAAAAASGSAYLGPGAQHAMARAAASDRMGRDREATSNAAAVAAAAMASVLGPEVIVPEQFPEALIRLACVRYRWGVINDEYDWDDDSSDYTDGEDENEACAAESTPVSPRMNRLVQQQKLQQQQAKCKRGPKVLRPEGRDRHRTAAPAVAQRSTAAGRSRSPSPGRGSAPDYQLPTEADDLVSVVKIFLQHEVLKCARRNRLAGSPLGHRRAQHKQPNLMRWEALPHGVLRD